MSEYLGGDQIGVEFYGSRWIRDGEFNGLFAEACWMSEVSIKVPGI